MGSVATLSKVACEMCGLMSPMPGAQLLCLGKGVG